MVTFFRDDVADIKCSQFLSFLSFLSDCFALLNRWLACAKSKTHYYFNQWIRVYQTLSIKKMKADCFLYCLEKTNVTLQLCKHTVCWSFLFYLLSARGLLRCTRVSTVVQQFCSLTYFNNWCKKLKFYWQELDLISKKCQSENNWC